MYYPKSRATPPWPGLVDKFAAAHALGLHPETLLKGLREGRIKLTPVPVRAPRRRRQHWFRLTEVQAERDRRAKLTDRTK